MVSLLLAFILCWDPVTDPALLGYWTITAERHIIEWVDCPCGDDPLPDCKVPPTQCPVYNEFVWEATFIGLIPRFQRNDCANVPYSICYFKYPQWQDFDLRMSSQPLITNDSITWNGICP